MESNFNKYSFDFESAFVPLKEELINKAGENIKEEMDNEISIKERSNIDNVEQVAINAITSMVNLCSMVCMAMLKKIDNE